MKRTIWILVLWLIMIALPAQARYLAKLDAGRWETDIWQTAQALDTDGIEVYYYTQNHILAGIPTDKGTQYEDISTRLSSLPLTGRLYLISSLDAQPISLPLGAGKVITEMDNALLLQSDLDEIQLRSQTAYPFTILDLQPLRFATDGMQMADASLIRSEITQMLNRVNPASVQGMMQGLEDFITRYALAPNRLEIAEWIRDKYLSFGLTDVQLFPFEWNNTTQYNVIATLPGSLFPEQYIVVGGHHDSTNNHGNPYESAPGADDNASGAVATLEMARVMMASGYQPRSSIRFMTFAAEEFGLWGSKAYAAWAKENDLNIRLMINHDMIAHNTASPGNWQVMLMPYAGSMEHSMFTSQITQNYTSLGAFFGSLNSGSSDSFPFWQQGYNVIYFFEEEFCPYYHSSNDLVINTDPLYAAEVIKASVAVAASFADMPSAPDTVQVFDAGDGQSLYVQWTAPDDPLVNSYHLYYGTQQYNLSGHIEVTGNSYTISGLEEGQAYYVGVSCVDDKGNESYRLYGVGTPYVIPQMPLEFYDIPQTDGIALNWAPNQETDLTGYHLYRSQQAGEEGVALTFIDKEEHSYLDTDVQGGRHFYYYTLKAEDEDGNLSQPTLQVPSRPQSMDQGILIIDETTGYTGATPFQPTDEEVDEFYDYALGDFEYDKLDLAHLPSFLRLADIGVYSSILWHINDLFTHTQPMIAQQVLDRYISNGGNILFSFYYPSMAFAMNAGYPASFDADNWLNSALGIASVDYANAARFLRAVPLVDGYPLLEVDPDKSIAPLNYHLINIEGMEVADHATAIYGYGNDFEDDTPQGRLNGMAVGIYNEYGEGKAITLSYPLYNMQAQQAKELVRYVFANVFKEGDGNDPNQNIVPALRFGNPYPNPFAGSTWVSLSVKDTSKPVQVSVYNLRGQLVRSLYDETGGKEIQLSWDGKDAHGKTLGSGIYIITAKQGKAGSSTKIVHLK
ncbi:MAG: M20/M25/M40 family metallo-hydrolase [Candidatus Cloacimonetes bacterium]|nr:M20/M25/M40 family metallo-hydrolase [Candidatus Cloacimonadota bacterium]